MNKRKSREPRELDVARCQCGAPLTRFRRLEDVFAHFIARDLERRGFPVDVENVAATVAKLWAAGKDKRDAVSEKSDQEFAALRQAAIAQLVPPAVQRKAQRKKRAATIDREVKACAAELKQCGVRDPVRQAEDEAAKRHGFRTGAALNRWRRRNR